jgi:AGCS family alanine or glycine:cation symporter
MIFKYAFMPQAILGGGIGAALKAAISQGAKRGLFSNEAGMGSTPHAHALAKVEKPHDQGVVAMIGVFIDTFVVLTLTALTVISTLYAGGGPLADGVAEGITKANMMQIAMGTLFTDSVGGILVAICLFFFAFSTILSWNLFGKINFVYLFGKRSALIYSILSIGFVLLGSFLSNDLVWELTDTFNYLMVIPNAIAIVALSSLVKKAATSAKTKKAKEAETKEAEAE